MESSGMNTMVGLRWAMTLRLPCTVSNQLGPDSALTLWVLYSSTPCGVCLDCGEVLGFERRFRHPYTGCPIRTSMSVDTRHFFEPCIQYPTRLEIATPPCIPQDCGTGLMITAAPSFKPREQDRGTACSESFILRVPCCSRTSIDYCVNSSYPRIYSTCS